MNYFLRYSIVRIIAIVGFVMVWNQYITAQSDTIPTSDETMEYVHHQKESILDHLIDTKMSSLEIETDLEELFMDRRYKKYKKAVATFNFREGETWTDSLEVKVRGVYRATNCDNPPLKIKYSKKLLKKRGLKKRNEYKLVYPCENSVEYQNYIYKEYLIYKLYNELTDKSLRVHLVDLTLKDAAQKRDNIEVAGFLIEHRDEITKRLDGTKYDTRCLTFSDMKSSENITLLEVFQYMIGNLDWVVENCKNIELVQLADSTVVPVPYDFDYTGFVNPSYAVPASKYNQKTLRDRFFKGQDKSLAELQPGIELFEEKKKTFIQLINDFDQLPKRERKAMIYYLKSFYSIINRPNQVKNIFVESE